MPDTLWGTPIAVWQSWVGLLVGCGTAIINMAVIALWLRDHALLKRLHAHLMNHHSP